MTVFKIAATALATATTFAMSSAAVFAMGGRSSRPGGSGGHGSSSMSGGSGGSSSASLSSSGSSSVSSSAAGGSDSAVGSSVTSVPEIDASTGLLAMAAVLAIVAFVWERNRRLNA